jgi:hypothetical protein
MHPHMPRKDITITDEQAKWIIDNHINLSRFVQDKLAEEMKKNSSPQH